MTFRLIATSVFGLESIVASEVRALGFTDVSVENGRVLFTADAAGIARANLWLRTAERVLVQVGAFKAKTFDDLFEGVFALPWDRYLSKEAAFPVNAGSVKSTLFSLSDIQRISKRAIVKKLTAAYHVEWFDECAETYPVHISILKDWVTVSLDTSGSGLHKRGYRARANEAPMKETLAAGLIQVSKWTSDRPLIDPMCGSGTIAIEAALMARNIAPGLSRAFISERWPWIGTEIWKAERSEAYAAIRQDVDPSIEGYDKDPRAIALARDNAERAGVDDCIHFQVRDIDAFSTKRQYGSIICNPPYGERLGDTREIEALYRRMGAVLNPYTTWSKYIITSFEGFEQAFGARASKNRKLYNGRIRTYFYLYFGVKGRPSLSGTQASGGSP